LSIYENIETLDIIDYLKIPKCKECKKKLKIKEFIPLIGFFFKSKKCFCCKRRIGIIKPIIEIGTAILFGLI
jgi:prepilin signal peptidase PulO-like enzyme (type II secretory pathway)